MFYTVINGVNLGEKEGVQPLFFRLPYANLSEMGAQTPVEGQPSPNLL